MALSLLAYTFIQGRVDDGALTASPQAGVWYDLDVAWGPASTDSAAAYTTALSCVGADIDTSHSEVYLGHRAPISGRAAVDLGWSPDDYPVWLAGQRNQCALAFWRIQFPTAGSYELVFANVGPITVTVTDPPPSPTSPTWTLLHPAPMGRGPAKVGTLAFDGDYPAGGLDVNDALVGCGGILFADVVCQPPYLFAWSASKLHVYDQNGEITTGTAINFTTTALFIGGGL